MKDFFISYAGPDRNWAEWIAWHLEETGYTTVLQAWDFVPGSNFVLEMSDAEIQTNKTIAVLSASYVQRPFTRSEWSAAFARDPAGENRRLIPVRVAEFQLEGLLAQIVYVDLVGLDEAKAREVLLAGLGRDGSKRAVPQSPPRFPGGVIHSVKRPQSYPGSHLEVGGKKSLRRFVHAKVTTHGLLDSELSGNPYASSFDMTDSQVVDSSEKIFTFFWLPNAEVLRSRQSSVFTPAAAICALNPAAAARTFNRLLGPYRKSFLEVAPGKMRNEEKEHILASMAVALQDSFVAAVTIPPILCGSDRSTPAFVYQVMIDLFLFPLLGMHRKIGFVQFHLRLASVGKCDPIVLKLVKRSAKAFYQKRDATSVEFAEREEEGKTLIRMARLFAWAVGHFYNSGDTKWVTLLEQNFDHDKGSSRLEEPMP